MSFGSRLPIDDVDPLFNSWVMAWDGHALLTAPWRLFSANIFYPYAAPLAYSDLMLPPAIAALPVNLITGNAIAGYNFIFLLSFVFSGVAMFLLIRQLTASNTAALLGGAAYAFSTYHFAQMGHLQLLTDGFIVMMVYFLHRYLIRRRTHDLALSGVFLSLQALSSWYYGFYGAFIAAAFLAFFIAVKSIRLNARFFKDIAWPVGIFALTVVPFALPYLKLRRTMPAFGRSLGEAVYYSALPRDYFSTLNPFWLKFFPSAAPPKVAVWEHLLWPGLFAVIFAVIEGVIVLKKTRDRKTRSKTGPAASSDIKSAPRNRIKLFYLLLGAGAMVLSFGPYLEIGNLEIPMPFLLAWRVVPGFKSMRVPSRIGLLVTFSLIILASYGWQELTAAYKDRFKIDKRLKFGLIVVIATAIVAAQTGLTLTLSSPVVSGFEVPPVYNWLAEQKNKNILELPSIQVDGDAAVGRWNTDTRYLYYSTYHWRRLVNGYSGYFPPEYSDFMKSMDDFPNPTSIKILRRLGIDYVVYHAASSRQAARLINKARLRQGIRIVARFGGDIVFAVGPPSAGPPPASITASFVGPTSVPVGAPVNVAWRITNTTKSVIVVRPQDQPSAVFSWNQRASGSMWPRLPLVLKPGEKSWMVAQIDGPAQAGVNRLTVKLLAPLIRGHRFVLPVRAVSGMPLSSDNNGLNGVFIKVRTKKTVRAGSVVPVEFEIKNTGRALWQAKFNPDLSLKVPFDRGEVHLTASWIKSNGREFGSPQVFPLLYDVGPNQHYNGTIEPAAPNKRGIYKLKFDLVVLGVVWFKDLGAKNPIKEVRVNTRL